ncbi:hypothetical protein P5F22_01800 [Clostridium perfringens]|nr:hypothetical protein [Clostridium perfringens]
MKVLYLTDRVKVFNIEIESRFDELWITKKDELICSFKPSEAYLKCIDVRDDIKEYIIKDR